MILKSVKISIIILLFLLKKSKSDLPPHCIEINIVNKTINPNENLFLNHTDNDADIDTYQDTDYVIFENGTEVHITKHDKECICNEPCLSLCGTKPIVEYYQYDDIEPSFLTAVILKNGDTIITNFLTKFNHRVITPCDEMYALKMEVDANDDWSFFENGTLLVHYGEQYHDNGKYCFDWAEAPQDGELKLLFAPYVCSLVNKHYLQDLIRTWAMVCSIPFFLIAILYYCWIPEWKNCHGKCFIMYLICLTINYALISYVNLTAANIEEIACLTIGYAIYFATISFLTWISIISYDTFISLAVSGYSMVFRVYLGFGLIIPSVLTLLLYFLETYSPLPDSFKPNIEPETCVINTKRWSALFYYFGPYIIVLVFCLTMYIKLIRFLVQHEKTAITQTGITKTPYKKRLYLYLRLFIFMGVVWFLEMLSYFMAKFLKEDTFLTLIPDLCIALHGLFIFLSIASSSNNWKMFKKRFLNRRYNEHELIPTSSLE